MLKGCPQTTLPASRELPCSARGRGTWVCLQVASQRVTGSDRGAAWWRARPGRAANACTSHPQTLTGRLLDGGIPWDHAPLSPQPGHPPSRPLPIHPSAPWTEAPPGPAQNRDGSRGSGHSLLCPRPSLAQPDQPHHLTPLGAALCAHDFLQRGQAGQNPTKLPGVQRSEGAQQEWGIRWLAEELPGAQGSGRCPRSWPARAWASPGDRGERRLENAPCPPATE